MRGRSTHRPLPEAVVDFDAVREIIGDRASRLDGNRGIRIRVQIDI
jgi:hypothetical protein